MGIPDFSGGWYPFTAKGVQLADSPRGVNLADIPVVWIDLPTSYMPHGHNPAGPVGKGVDVRQAYPCQGPTGY